MDVAICNTALEDHEEVGSSDVDCCQVAAVT